MNVDFWYYAAIILDCISILIFITSGWLSFKGENDYSDFNIGFGIFFLSAGLWLINSEAMERALGSTSFQQFCCLWQRYTLFIHGIKTNTPIMGKLGSCYFLVND